MVSTSALAVVALLLGASEVEPVSVLVRARGPDADGAGAALASTLRHRIRETFTSLPRPKRPQG